MQTMPTITPLITLSVWAGAIGALTLAMCGKIRLTRISLLILWITRLQFIGIQTVLRLMARTLKSA